jgi:hypothetical protein
VDGACFVAVELVEAERGVVSVKKKWRERREGERRERRGERGEEREEEMEESRARVANIIDRGEKAEWGVGKRKREECEWILNNLQQS